jgi:hypothetical protein
MPIYMTIDSFMSPPKHLEVAARQTMQQVGVSQQGVDQFLKGQVVVSLSDRTKLANLVVRNFVAKLQPCPISS